MEEQLKQRLIDFQNFLIMDGQLDIDSDEVISNAAIFEKSINLNQDKPEPLESMKQGENEVCRYCGSKDTIDINIWTICNSCGKAFE